ncbi:unnamed protein product [Lathyrus sativus]|nr:unnamed protein product [Lathyrus sativus]
MDEFHIDFHHGGYFVNDKYIGGEVSNWKCDGDRWSYFEILGVVKEIKYPGVQEIWHDFVGTLKALEDGFDSDYATEDLESEDDISCEHSHEDENVKYPSFVMPKRFNHYKWVLRSFFSTKRELEEVIASYVVHNGRDLRCLKNDNIRVRVGCKEGCGWVALRSKFPNAGTWQLRTLNDNHTCNREFNVKMFNSNWLRKKVYTTVRINPNVKLTAICEKVHEKWNVGMSRMKAYREWNTSLNIVEGSFKKQYHRLCDYAHELLR